MTSFLIASAMQGLDKARSTFRAVKMLWDTMVVDTCLYIFVQTHRMDDTKSDP